MKQHYCDERLLPEECIVCLGVPRPTVLFESWAGTYAVPCEILKRTPRRFKVRFVATTAWSNRGEIRYVPHYAVRDGDGNALAGGEEGRR